MAMMSQVNYYSPRLRLPINVPVTEQDIRYSNVVIPSVRKSVQTFGGRIQVKNYSFTFFRNSTAVYNLAEDGLQSYGFLMRSNESSISGMERASRMKYVVSTNDVYRLATNYLVALDIILEKLEKNNPPQIDASMFHSERGLVPSPLLSVSWRNANASSYDPYEIMVEISAVSGELLKFKDVNGSFSNRQQPLIKDLDKLLAISDEEFLKYSDLERSNLVVRFAAVHYPPADSPKLEPGTSQATATNSTSIGK